MARASNSAILVSAETLNPVRMRQAPTVVAKALALRAYRMANGAVVGPGTRNLTVAADQDSWSWFSTGWSGLTTPNTYSVMTENTGSFTFVLDAEIY